MGHGGVDDPAAAAAELMTGWFSSRAQAAADPESFYDIHLVMHPIWENRRDGWWFYVEQASATSLDQPYRQRVYHVYSIAEDTVMSDVYTLPGDPLEFVGLWRQAAPSFRADELVLREGCSITLRRSNDGHFHGGTEDRSCPSALRGAVYATSAVSVLPGKLMSWDRGFDAMGDQVWGASEGPYVFERISREPPE